MVHLVLHDWQPGRRQLWDVLLGLVEVGHGGVQAAPGVLLRVVHLQSRRGAVSVLENEALRAAELIVPQRFIHDQQQQTRQERQGDNNQPSQLQLLGHLVVKVYV